MIFEVADVGSSLCLPGLNRYGGAEIRAHLKKQFRCLKIASREQTMMETYRKAVKQWDHAPRMAALR